MWTGWVGRGKGGERKQEHKINWRSEGKKTREKRAADQLGTGGLEAVRTVWLGSKSLKRKRK